MVEVFGALLILSANTCADPIGVVRVSRGETQVHYAHGTSGPTAGLSGVLLCRGTRVSVGVGWAELLVGLHSRIRLSAETRLFLSEEDQLEVLKGRVWVQTGAKGPEIEFQVSQARLMVMPGTSSIIESARNGIATVLKGQVKAGHQQVIAAKQTGFLNGIESPRVGGEEIQALVRREARAGLGDLAGWKAFLLKSIQEMDLAQYSSSPVNNEVRARSVPIGASITDNVAEEALRPSPFSDENTP